MIALIVEINDKFFGYCQQLLQGQITPLSTINSVNNCYILSFTQ